MSLTRWITEEKHDEDPPRLYQKPTTKRQAANGDQPVRLLPLPYGFDRRDIRVDRIEIGDDGEFRMWIIDREDGEPDSQPSIWGGNSNAAAANRMKRGLRISDLDELKGRRVLSPMTK